MYNKNYYRLFLLILCCLLGYQTQAQSSEEPLVRRSIEQLFEGMKQGDTLLLSPIMAEQVLLRTVIEKEEEVMINEVARQKFMKAVASPHEQIWDERITDYNIQIDDRLATAWTPYQFYLGNTFSHCGVNAFQLYKSENGWKILSITDTRRKENCID